MDPYTVEHAAHGGVNDSLEPDCFERWLADPAQANREDAVGKVARYVFSAFEENWPHSHQLWKRHDRTYDVQAHQERWLELDGFPEESIETFRQIYEQYERSGPGGDPYDQKVEAAKERIDASFDLPEVRRTYIEAFDRYAGGRDLSRWLILASRGILAARLAEGEEPDFDEVVEAATVAAESFK